MIKLKELTESLNDSLYCIIEEALIKNKADNFLFLLKSYRQKNMKDAEIIKALDISPNSFYVLKSRLYNKIQGYLYGEGHCGKEDLLKQLHRIPLICVTESKEVSTAFLHGLEKDLLTYEMNNELVVVYSAFKKIYLYSEKYFYYSQLFNKHIAYSLSLEKSEEILGNFNIVLAQYLLSNSKQSLETLLFLRKTINEQYSLNQSRQIELIKNIIDIQLQIFCNNSVDMDFSAEALLLKSQAIIDEQSNTSPYKVWYPAINYLYFQYYIKINQPHQALPYYIKCNALLPTLLLYNNVCLTSSFLLSKIVFLQELKKIKDLKTEDPESILVIHDDTHTLILLGIYKATLLYHSQKYKEASTHLNELLNLNSFKDLFHIHVEIKLFLIYLYILIKEYDLAESISINIYRKIKSEQLDQYANVLELIKVFGIDTKQKNNKITSKQNDYFLLFLAKNVNESKLLPYLIVDLKNRYL
jgi:hypothetical protein